MKNYNQNRFKAVDIIEWHFLEVLKTVNKSHGHGQLKLLNG